MVHVFGRSTDLKMGTFWYLASPYTKYAEGPEAAFREVCRNGALLLLAGIPVFSPIAHTHPISVHGGIEAGRTFWLAADKPFMHTSQGMIILEMDGWQDSEGVSAETAYFLYARKPIITMTPGRVPEVLRVWGHQVLKS